MLTVAIPKRNKLQNIIVLTPKDGQILRRQWKETMQKFRMTASKQKFDTD